MYFSPMLIQVGYLDQLLDTRNQVLWVTGCLTESLLDSVSLRNSPWVSSIRNESLRVSAVSASLCVEDIVSSLKLLLCKTKKMDGLWTLLLPIIWPFVLQHGLQQCTAYFLLNSYSLTHLLHFWMSLLA